MNGQTIPSDSELLAEYLDAGRGSAFEQLVRRHAALVSGVCRGILRQSHDADDATQAAFLTLARKAPTLRKHPTIAGWLHRVAWHIAMRARESRDLRQRREGQAAPAEVPDNSTSAADEEQIAAVRAALHEQLAAMPEKYRVPLILHHLEGWSEAEVASMLGLKQGTASGRLSRGRQILRDRLERRGVGTGAVAIGLMAPSARSADVAPADLAIASASPLPPRVVALSSSALHMLASLQRRKLIAVAVAAILLLSGVFAGSMIVSSRSSVAMVTTAPAETGQITGTVLDPQRTAVDGVTVRVYNSESDAGANKRPVATVRTDANGEFHIESVPAKQGYFVLFFVQQPQFMHARKSADVKAGEITRMGEIVLQTGRY